MTALRPETLRPLRSDTQCRRTVARAVPWLEASGPTLPYESLDALLHDLPAEAKLLHGDFVGRIVEGEITLPRGLKFGLRHRPNLHIQRLKDTPLFADLAHIESWKEDGLDLLEGLELGQVSSLYFNDFLPKKKKKLPSVDLRGVRRVFCNGQMLTLEHLLGHYELNESLSSLSLQGGFKKANTFVFEPARLPSLRALEFCVMASEKSLLALFANANFKKLESLDLSGNRLTPKVAAAAAKCGIEQLRDLRIGGQDLKPGVVSAWLDLPFPNLETLDVRNSRTLAKGDFPTGVMKALARVSSPPPIETLIATLTTDRAALAAFAKAQPFPKLRRVLLHAPHVLTPEYGYAIASAPQILADPTICAIPMNTLDALAPLEAAGLEVHLFA